MSIQQFIPLKTLVSDNAIHPTKLLINSGCLMSPPSSLSLSLYDIQKMVERWKAHNRYKTANPLGRLQQKRRDGFACWGQYFVQPGLGISEGEDEIMLPFGPFCPRTWNSVLPFLPTK